MTELNPDAVILQQLQGQWQKMVALVVFKLAKEKGVKITQTDITAFMREYERTGMTLMTWGHFDSIEFKLVTREEAERLAAWDKQQRGNA